MAALLGAHAWWLPSWLERAVPRIQLEGDASEPAADGSDEKRQIVR